LFASAAHGWTRSSRTLTHLHVQRGPHRQVHVLLLRPRDPLLAEPDRRHEAHADVVRVAAAGQRHAWDACRGTEHNDPTVPRCARPSKGPMCSKKTGFAIVEDLCQEGRGRAAGEQATCRLSCRSTLKPSRNSFSCSTWRPHTGPCSRDGEDGRTMEPEARAQTPLPPCDSPHDGAAGQGSARLLRLWCGASVRDESALRAHP
jgi:hypothetical protein